MRKTDRKPGAIGKLLTCYELRGPSVLAATAAMTCMLVLPIQAQHSGDFISVDEEGHLILRYAGINAAELSADQHEELLNVQLSTMVHDRIRADAVFEAEPVDRAWAIATTRRIRTELRTDQAGYRVAEVECRNTTCRIEIEHPAVWQVPAHQAVMNRVQSLIESYIREHPDSLDSTFLIAAHYQEPATPYIKAFVRRRSK